MSDRAPHGRGNRKAIMSSFTPAAFDNLHLIHDIVTAIRSSALWLRHIDQHS